MSVKIKASKLQAVTKKLYATTQGLRNVNANTGMSNQQFEELRKAAKNRATKNNNIFIYKLTSFIDHIGTEAFIVLIARSIDYAVQNAAVTEGGTIHDTGRAAANWDVSISGGNPRNRNMREIDPHKHPYSPARQYNSRLEKYWARAGSDGTRKLISDEGLGQYRSHGAVSSVFVPKVKAALYGYEPGMSTTGVVNSNGEINSAYVFETSWIRRKFEGNKRPSVHLINPIFGGARRPDGNGTPYQENAFEGVTDLQQRVIIDAEARLSDFVIIAINEFNRQVQFDLNRDRERN